MWTEYISPSSLKTQSLRVFTGHTSLWPFFQFLYFPTSANSLIMKFNHDSSYHNHNQSKKRKQPHVDNYTSLELSTSNMNPRRCLFFLSNTGWILYFLVFQGLRHFIWLTVLQIDIGFAECMLLLFCVLGIMFLCLRHNVLEEWSGRLRFSYFLDPFWLSCVVFLFLWILFIPLRW